MLQQKSYVDLERQVDTLMSSGFVEKALESSDASISLKNHTKEFKKDILKVVDNIYVAIGYGLANVVLIKTKTGIMI